MKNLKLITLTLLTIAFTFSCAHPHKIESVQEAQEIPKGLKVKIGSKEVQEGDNVDILKRTCATKRLSSKHTTETNTEKCKFEKIGDAKVLKVLSKDSAIIDMPENFNLSPDLFVEKNKNN